MKSYSVTNQLKGTEQHVSVQIVDVLKVSHFSLQVQEVSALSLPQSPVRLATLFILPYEGKKKEKRK